jgi:competence protein ComEC
MPHIAVAAIVCWAAILVQRQLPVYRQFRLRFVTGLWLHLLLLLAGMARLYVADIKNTGDWFGHRQYDLLLVETAAEARFHKGSQTLAAEVKQIRQGKKWLPACGRVVLRLPADMTLHPGSMVGFEKKPTAIPEPANGAKFNYKAFMAIQQVHHQVQLRKEELMIIRSNPPPGGAIRAFRQNILAVLDRQFPGAERALAKALLVGYRSELDKELVTAYTNTGVIHIIAISGLHLGIIYALLIMIMKPLARRKRTRVVINVIVMLVLWIFTFICGASPSVTRSAVMFSSILVGDSMGDDNNTGNAVASSAFLLLCYDPMLIWDLGFQLSYAAVASLLIYNQAITRIFLPENGLLAMAWNSIATSISAQILTTPLVLVHFHQFPVLFILSNFVAVPVSGLILILLILIVALQWSPLLPALLSSLTAWCIRFMNNQIERIASVRFSVWENIQWTWPDLVLSYLAILTLTLFIREKTFTWLILFLLTILTWLIASKYSSL